MQLIVGFDFDRFLLRTLVTILMLLHMVQLNSKLILVLITHECLEILFGSLISDRMLFVSNSCSVTYLTCEW